MSSITVQLARAPFSNNVTLTFEDGSSDLLPHRKARESLISLGMLPDQADKVLDHCWNFYKAKVTIKRKIK